MPRNLRFMNVLAPSVAAVFIVAGSASAATKPVTLTVFAAASLREAFTDVARELRSKDATTVRFNFGGSNQLATQIVLGAPADVFASADARQMQIARAHGALDGTASVFAGNRLVVVVPTENPAHIRSVRDLARRGVRLVLAAPGVPVGRYARAAFSGMANEAAYGSDFERRVLANVISEETDVKAVAAKVALGEADAGVVYATDVGPLGSRVSVFGLPMRYAPVARYFIAVVRATVDARVARRFIAFVRGARGQAILARHGFLSAR
ncbi:MAG: molybdate ABC transporter substrate-binding protein [Candidatus Eremiobacteraeota bacterium]|nr:molybdate ABC transporter substrate-binding protein [Candidatus Eremiobacteraeota bacterium]